jgi:hypothetical protein
LCPPDDFGGLDFMTTNETPEAGQLRAENSSKGSFRRRCADVKEYGMKFARKNVTAV